MEEWKVYKKENAYKGKDALAFINVSKSKKIVIWEEDDIDIFVNTDDSTYTEVDTIDLLLDTIDIKNIISIFRKNNMNQEYVEHLIGYLEKFL